MFSVKNRSNIRQVTPYGEFGAFESKTFYPVSKIYANVGEIKNTGLEVTIQYYVVENKNFSWETDFDVSSAEAVFRWNFFF